jgi:phosphopantetheinyl transferase (holo-ACP synthase)
MRRTLTSSSRIKIPPFKARLKSLKDAWFFVDEISDRVESMAGIYAAKKAIGRALGMPAGEASKIHIKKTREGKPYAVIGRIYLKRIASSDLSISHDGDYAVAFFAFQLKKED